MRPSLGQQTAHQSRDHHPVRRLCVVRLRTDHLSGAGSSGSGNGQDKVSVDLDPAQRQGRRIPLH
jgi:hypothetical protein